MRIKFIFIAGMLTSLAACGSGGSGSSNTSTQPNSQSASVAEALQRLEHEGRLPVLDRSDSLLGTDVDSDGVRDDVQAYIEKLPDTPIEKRALMQSAKSFGVVLTADTRSEEALEAASKASFRSSKCMFDTFGAESFNRRDLEIQKLMINTPERFRAYAEYNDARNGSVSTAPVGNTCE